MNFAPGEYLLQCILINASPISRVDDKNDTSNVAEVFDMEQRDTERISSTRMERYLRCLQRERYRPPASQTYKERFLYSRSAVSNPLRGKQPGH
jgi:hypothetical protein